MHSLLIRMWFVADTSMNACLEVDEILTAFVFVSRIFWEMTTSS